MSVFKSIKGTFAAGFVTIIKISKNTRTYNLLCAHRYDAKNVESIYNGRNLCYQCIPKAL